MVASYYKPSGLAISGALAGTELVTVDNGGPLPTTVTTRQIANLAGAEEDLITTVSTVGAATLTGAAVVGGIIVRSGSQSNTAFSDTLPTAALLLAALPVGSPNGHSWFVSIQNTTNANETITSGSGVVVSGITVVKSGTTATFLATKVSDTSFTLVGFQQTAPVSASGTVIANEATAVVVADTRVTANSVIVFTMKTVGGTPAGAPFLSAVTAGTGFSVKSVVGDTSTYNYLIIG